MTSPKNTPFSRQSLLVLVVLFLLIIGVRLLSVYPPTLRHDPATIALQACRILDGERPIFWSGQAWMGALGTYVEAGLFQLLGKNSLVMSLYAWASSGVWIFLSLLLAWRFFGPRAAIYSAVIWLVPTSALMYWSSQARNDFHALFIATPGLLLLTHDIVRRFRDGGSVTVRMAFLGFVGGVSFWQNMAIGPCLVVSFAVLALHLGWSFWRREVWFYAPAWLLGFSPVLYYNLANDLVLRRQGSLTNLSTVAKASCHLLTNALPDFWGMQIVGRPWSAGKAAQLFFLLWMAVLLGLYVGMVYRKWKRREDLLPDQLVLGLLFFHVLVPTVTQYGRSFATSGNPILYLTNLYSVAFLIPAIVLASRSRATRLLMALPFLIYFGNNVKNTLVYPQAFFSALGEKGAAAVDRFPDLEDPLIKTLMSKNLSQGYMELWRSPILNLLGLHHVEFSRPYQDRVVEYSLRTDAARDIFWVAQRGLPEGFRMIGSRFETSNEQSGLVYYGFRKDAARETLLENYTVTASHDPSRAALLSDRRVDTVWELPSPLPETTIRFDFPSEQRVARITLLPGDSRTLPTHLIVQSSRDGVAWETVDEWKEANVYFWSVRHPFLKIVKPRCELAIALSEPVRHLRLVIPAQRGACAFREIYLHRAESPGSPGPSLDDEIEAIAQAFAPLKRTHRIVGDHYFMSYFKLAGFDVEFIPNRAVNNSGLINPFLFARLPLDFARPLALIVPKSHSAATARQLERGGVPHRRQELFYHDIYFTSPGAASTPLYWSGFDLLQVDPVPAGTGK